MSIVAIFLILLSVSMSAAAQICLKFGMSKADQAGVLARAAPLDLMAGIATQPFVVGGLALYGAGAVVWLAVLSRLDVSVAYPFVGLGFIMTMFLAAILLGEHVTLIRGLGTLLVVAGVVLVAQS